MGKESILYQAQAGLNHHFLTLQLINCEGREIGHFVQNLGLFNHPFSMTQSLNKRAIS